MSKMSSIIALLVLMVSGVACQTTGKVAERDADSPGGSAVTASPQAAEAPRDRTDVALATPVAPDRSEQQDARDPEIGNTFKSRRLAIEHYESQGFRTIGQFARSRWPARVVYVKDAMNAIRVTLKKGGTHGFPDHSGYRLKAVFLEDPAGDETVLIFRSLHRLPAEAPPKPAGQMR